MILMVGPAMIGPAYIVNALINVMLRHTCFKCVWLVYFCLNNV